MRLAQIGFAFGICVLFAGACTTISPEEREATFKQGVTAYDAGHFALAFQLFDSISYDDAAAARNTGLMLRKGQGVERDPQAALIRLQQAAGAGLPTASADVGEMLLDGEAGRPDPEAALPYLEVAAAAHHVVAEYHIGTLYERGLVLPKDLAKARAFYAAAAAGGVQQAEERLNRLDGTQERTQFRRYDTITRTSGNR
jgi:TPR repeat protein